MATYDHYTAPVPSGTWDVPAAGATRFSWEYDDGRSRLLDLYQRGKDKQWDAAKRIDWSLPVNPSNVMEQSDEFCPIYGSRQWDLLSKSERDGRVRQLLGEVGMEDALNKMPSDISGGMQKRAGLARALALEPEILLLDEPTAGLDPISSGEIDELILKLQTERKMASIVVTHDLHSAKTIASRIALLDQGNVVIHGTFEELQQSDIAFVKEFLKQS